MIVTEDAERHIEQYTALALELNARGGSTKEEWEHARSYAVDALTSLLRANPDRFRYALEMERVLLERRTGVKHPTSSTPTNDRVSNESTSKFARRPSVLAGG